MPCGLPMLQGRKGQSATEVALLLPVFLLLVFGILQTCHLGIAIALVNYGASSAARQAVQMNDRTGAGATQRFNNLLAAGLKPLGAVRVTSDHESPAENITVTACAELQAYPLIGELLDKALQPSGGDPCGGTKSLGPFSLKGPAPFHFVIHGQATVRMNYDPKG